MQGGESSMIFIEGWQYLTDSYVKLSKIFLYSAYVTLPVISHPNVILVETSDKLESLL